MINSIDKISVAHFRRGWFLSTETFIYNYIKEVKKTYPILICYDRDNEDQFPIDSPIIELYRRGSISWFDRGIRCRVFGGQANPHFSRSQTYQTIKFFDVKLLHAHFGYTGYHVLPIKLRTNLPLITTFYGHDVSRMPKSPEWSKKFEELFKSGDLFLVEGPFMQERLIELGCPPEKSEIQRIAIAIDDYPFRVRKPKKSAEPVRIFFCGTFTEKKGLIFAMKAISKAHTKFKNLEFRIAGDGELKSEIDYTINKRGMHNYTKLLGFISHQQMIAEMNAADIFIHPSITAKDGDSEGGAPTVILEAQTCGLPILSTYHADIPNVVLPGESALLSPERNVDALYNNLVTLIEDQERWADMGQFGHAFIEDKHDIQKEVKNLEKKYAQLLN